MKAIKAIYNGIDKFNDFLGRIFSVLSLAILAVIMCEVILRRIFNRPQIWTQDLIVMLFACYIILISAYGLQKKAFVAVDVVYAMFPVRVQHILHIVTYAIFLVPFLMGLVPASWTFFLNAYTTGEQTYSVWAAPTWPVKLCLFVGLAVYIAALPGAADGYRYMFVLKPEGLLDPMVWVYALGQAFFSLSVAGNGTLIYGSYLSKEADVPESARTVAFFDTMAAVLSALVIIPAMATAGETLTQSGPGLMFIYLPNLFREMPGGRILMAVFFVAALFAGVTSLVNLFEAPTATLQEKLHLSRGTAVAVIGVVGLAVGLCIQGIVSGWMDVCSIYACPVGALLAAVFFFWIYGKKDCLEQVNLARRTPLGGWFYPLAKYGFCGVTVFVLILGALLGGIG